MGFKLFFSNFCFGSKITVVSLTIILLIGFFSITNQIMCLTSSTFHLAGGLSHNLSQVASKIPNELNGKYKKVSIVISKSPIYLYDDLSYITNAYSRDLSRVFLSVGTFFINNGPIVVDKIKTFTKNPPLFIVNNFEYLTKKEKQIVDRDFFTADAFLSKTFIKIEK